MSKVLKFKPKSEETEVGPVEVALEEIRNGFTQEELDDMFEELDDDEKFMEIMTKLTGEEQIH